MDVVNGGCSKMKEAGGIEKGFLWRHWWEHKGIGEPPYRRSLVIRGNCVNLKITSNESLI